MAQEDTIMGNAPLTPGEEPEPQNPVVDFSPATVAYDEAFENSLMEIILNPDTKTSRTPDHERHMIAASQLPIPLSSNLRTHASPIPGLYLTQPNGYHTGGPAPATTTVKEFADRFIAEHSIEDAGQLERVVEMVVQDKTKEVIERMERRNEAVEKNRAVERELEDLRLQRSAELRVMERLKGGKR